MSLDATARMRSLAVLIALLVAACPSTQHPGNGDDNTTDGGAGGDGGPQACANPIPTCSVTIKYAGAGTHVELHGDFSADGWTTGMPMTQTADGWEVTLPANDQQIIVYKFVVDGN